MFYLTIRHENTAFIYSSLHTLDGLNFHSFLLSSAPITEENTNSFIQPPKYVRMIQSGSETLKPLSRNSRLFRYLTLTPISKKKIERTTQLRRVPILFERFLHCIYGRLSRRSYILVLPIPGRYLYLGPRPLLFISYQMNNAKITSGADNNICRIIWL